MFLGILVNTVYYTFYDLFHIFKIKNNKQNTFMTYFIFLKLKTINKIRITLFRFLKEFFKTMNVAIVLL